MCTNLTLLMKSTQCALIITPFAFVAIMVMLIQLLASTCKEEEGDFEGDTFVESSYKSKTTQQKNYVHDSMVNAFYLNNYIFILLGHV